MDTPIHVSTGTLFAGQFRIAQQLSSGGMGVVYAVEQASTGKARALKLMHPQLCADAKLRERFEQEARVSALIPSDHVVQVIGAGVDEGTGIPWIAMELLDGEDLDRYVTRRGPLPPAEVVAVFRQLCHALGAAHEVGVVHRDLKPENVFVTSAQAPGSPTAIKVLDFGISKIVAEAHRSTTAALGTPLWMAPEQSDPKATITPASDVWSLGLVAFWMLTGKMFWSSVNLPGVSMQAVLRELLFEPIPAASARASEIGVGHLVPEGFDGWFARCVCRDVGARHATAAEAYAALRAALPAAATAAVTLPPAEQSGAGHLVRKQLSAFPAQPMRRSEVGSAAPPPKRRAAFSAIAAGALAAVVVAGGAAAYASGYLRLGKETRPPAPATPTAPVPSTTSESAPPISDAPPVASQPPEAASAAEEVARARTVSAPVKPRRRFDATEAHDAVKRATSMARVHCKHKDGPRSVTARVTFRRDGLVSRVLPDPRIRVTPSGLCITNLMSMAKMPPFDEPEEGTVFASASMD